MAKNTVTDWDSTPSNNSDISGINIAEGCPAGGINDAIRVVMAQIAVWIISVTGPLLKSGGVMTGAITAMGNASSISDGQPSTPANRLVGYRNIPFTAATTGRTLVLTDVGMCVPTTGTITVPPNSSVAFAIGDTIAVYNNSGSTITIAQGSGVTIRLGGSATTGNRSLAQRGFVTVMKVATDEWSALNGGVS